MKPGYFVVDAAYIRDQARIAVRNYFAPLRWIINFVRGKTNAR